MCRERTHILRAGKHTFLSRATKRVQHSAQRRDEPWATPNQNVSECDAKDPDSPSLILLEPKIVVHPCSPDASMESGTSDGPCLCFCVSEEALCSSHLPPSPHIWPRHKLYYLNSPGRASQFPPIWTRSRFLRSLTCIQKRFSNTHVNFLFPCLSLSRDNDTLGMERWLSSREH